MFRLFTIFYIILGVSSAFAEPAPLIKITKTQTFGLPIDCSLNEDCWIMNYVDMGPNDNKKTDPACLSRTYDTHKGTDFAVSDGQAMETGVSVIATADGTVTKIRDGEPDIWATETQMEEIKAQRKECGNAVMIDHEDGLQTIYCHMKKGSIAVKPDQKIKKGDVIGQVGLSGFTQFPHVHFGILKDNKIIDPFTGIENTNSCGKKRGSLWDKELNVNYQPFIIQSTGFLNDIPDLKSLEKDNKPISKISVSAELITFWSILYGVQEGDKITLEITDPNGKILASREIIQDKTRARQFYYTGRKTTKIKLIEGAYTGKILIERNYKGEKLADKKISAILVTP